MERIIISCIVGGMFAAEIAMYRSAFKSPKFSDLQTFLLKILLIFPPLFFLVIFIIYIFNEIKFSKRKDVKQYKSTVKEVSKLEDVKEKLEALKNSNLLTNEEFIVKLKQLDDRVYNQTILNSSEYQNLTTLLENNFLTKEEFDKKISALKEQFSHVNSPIQYKQQKQRYIINGVAYFYEEIESFFADGNYLFSKNSDIEVENQGIKKVTDIPSLSKILKYFPPN